IVMTVAPSELGIRFSGGSVSFNFMAVTATIKMPIKAKKKKMLRQFADSKDSDEPPTMGAIIVATALITIKIAKNFVDALPLNTSRTTGLERTTPDEAVNPCINRA